MMLSDLLPKASAHHRYFGQQNQRYCLLINSGLGYRALRNRLALFNHDSIVWIRQVPSIAFSLSEYWTAAH